MDKINKVVDIFKSGGIVIFPTDTAYGIGCRMDNLQAIERLIDIRKRPEGKAFPVLVDSIATAQKYLESIPENVKRELIEKYWPGGLTIVLNCVVDMVPDKVRGGGRSLGVRAPKNQRLSSIINKLGVPILGPSANYAGGTTPFRVADIDESLINQVDFVLEGDHEINPKSQASTVIDCTAEPWRILRKGAVNI